MILDHVECEEPAFDGHGDFGGAGRFGAVADHAGRDGEGVRDDVFNFRVRHAFQEGDAGGAPAAGAYRPAVGGEFADALFESNGDEVGQKQCTQNGVMRRLECLTVNRDRDACGDALVAAS